MGRHVRGPNGKFVSFDSERQKLCEVVRVVARSLKRPVCADDVRAHVTASPAHQPLMRQAIGQLLFKTAGRRGDPTLVRIGLIGNRAFYAPSQDPVWRKRFLAHQALVALRHEIRGRFPETAKPLLKTSHESIARNALAGWLVHTENLLACQPTLSKGELEEIDDLRRVAQKHSAPSYTLVEPGHLISRSEARKKIRDAMAKRVPWRVNLPGVTPNWNRYLAELRWPQCALFQQREQPVYWPYQMEAFFAASWPTVGDRLLEARALLGCLRYGAYGVQDSGKTTLKVT